MGEDAPPVDINQSSQNKAWHSYISEDLPRTVQESTDSAIRSARSIQNTSSTHLRTLQVLSITLPFYNNVALILPYPLCGLLSWQSLNWIIYTK